MGEIIHGSGADPEIFHSGVEEIKGGGGKIVEFFFYVHSRFIFINIIGMYKYQYKTNK